MRCRICGVRNRYRSPGLAKLHLVAQHRWLPFLSRDRDFKLWQWLFIDPAPYPRYIGDDGSEGSR